VQLLGDALDSGLPHRLGRRIVAVLAAAALAVLCLAAVAGWLLLRDSRVDLQPEYFVGEEGPGIGIPLLAGANDVTASICEAEFPCASAWGSGQMVLMKFASKNDAAAAARSLGSLGYRSDWLVANFIDESVSEAERRYAAEVMDGAWQSEVD